MSKKISIVNLEDNQNDFELNRETLAVAGLDFEMVRVETREEFAGALTKPDIDIILADYSLPAFDGLTALALARATRPDVPVLFVTGSMGEEPAIAAMRQGATDYVLKERLTKLPAAVQRALQEREERIARGRVEEDLRRERALLQVVFDSTDVMLVHLDCDFNFVTVNEAYAATCRMTPAAMVGRNHFDLYPHEENEAIFRKVRDTGEAVFFKDKPFVFPDQPERGVTYWDWSLVPVRDAAGRTQGLVLSLRETTAFKKVELSLRESEERFRTLAHLAPAGIYQTGPDGRCLLANQRWCEMAGMSQKEALGDGWVEGLHPDDRNTVFSSWQRMVESEGRWGMEYRFRTPAGKVTWVYGLAAPQRNDEGVITGYIGINTDITERKRAEEALRASEALYHDLVETAQDLIWQCDVEGRYIFLNSAWEDVFGYRVDEMLGRKFTDFQTPDNAAHDIKTFDMLLKEGTVKGYESTHLAKDGRELHLVFNAKFVRDRQGNISGTSGTAYDVTSRKQAEEALRESKETFRRLVQNLHTGVVVHAPDTHILLANERASVLLGLTIDQMMGKTAIDPAWRFVRENNSTMPPEEYPVNQVITSRAPLGYQVVGINRPETNDFIWVQVSAFPEFDVHGSLKQVVVTFVDITERKQAEDALRESETRLREALGAANAGIWEWDLKTNRNIWSEELWRHYGLSPKDWEPSFAAWRHSIHPDDLEAAEATVIAAASRGIEFTLEWRVNLPAGQTRWLMSVGKPLPDARGEVTGYRGVAIEITERKKAEAEANARAAISQLLLQRLPLEETCGRLAETLVAILGFPIAAIEFYDAPGREMVFMGMAGIAGFSPGVRVPMEQTISGTVAASGVEVCETNAGMRPEYQYEALRRLGVETFICVPLRTETEVIGTLALADCHARDDAESWLKALLSIGTPLAMGILHRRAERLLKESEERFRQIAETIREVFWVGSADWTQVHYISPAYEKVWGKTCQSLYDNPMSWLDAVHPDDREMVRSAIAEKACSKHFHPDFSAYRVVRPDGIVYWIYARAFPVFDADGKVVRVAGIAEDITERKRAEEEKEKLQEQLIQAQKMEVIGRLAGGVAHDFNNMLAVILGYVEMLKSEQDFLLNRTALDAIEKAATRSRDITRQLLAFSRKQVISPKPLDLNAVITDAHKILDRVLGEDIHLTLHLSGMLHRVLLDPSQVDQILLNLGANARDAMPEGGELEISTESVLLSERDCRDTPEVAPGPYVMLGVRDHGRGMDRETLSHVFEPFFTTKGLGKGTGLGLATVYGIVKQNNGHIEVQSAPDEGATFKLYFPALPEAPDAESLPENSAIPTGSGTVLLVEDDEMVRDLLTAMLRQLGYDIVTSSTAEEALTVVDKSMGRLDLLITDIVLPGMNGKELSRKLEAEHPGLKVIFISGYPAEIITSKGVREEGMNFLQKPFSRRDVARKVKEVLG